MSEEEAGMPRNPNLATFSDEALGYSTKINKTHNFKNTRHKSKTKALQVGLEPTASRLEVSRATIAPLILLLVGVSERVSWKTNLELFVWLKSCNHLAKNRLFKTIRPNSKLHS
jgi:hypothetical protein